MGFFSSLTGGDQRRRAKESQRFTAGILGNEADRSDKAYNSAINRLSQFETGGQGAEDFEFYRDLLGRNGGEAQETSQDVVFDDPAFQRISELNTNRLMRRFNAGGSRFSGAALQGANRLGLEQYENRLNRFRDLGQGGREFDVGLASKLGGLDIGKAQARSGFEIGKANNFSNLQSSLNQIGTQGVNNLLQFGGSALKAATAPVDPTSFAAQFAG